MTGTPQPEHRLSAIPPGALSYQDAKAFARDSESAVRQALAARPDVPPEILYFLADDPDPVVRRRIVHNPATPPLAHLVLMEDMDVDVRSDLAERIVTLAPGLTRDEQDRARQTAYRVLDRLVRDHLPRVRKILAEALKDVAEAPADIIGQLARDVESTIAAPILEFSPVLRDEDLLDIIGENPSSAALSAISRRTRIAPSVSDAIASSTDSAAIASLLANPSAQIREETLDMLVSQAANNPSWHDPLVRRPGLRHETALRLAHFVADRFLQVMLKRQDLAPETLAELHRVVHRRLSEVAAPEQTDLPRKDPPLDESANQEREQAFEAIPCDQLDTRDWSPSFQHTYDQCASMGRDGILTAQRVSRAVSKNDVPFVIAALAVRAQLAPAVVSSILRAASGRGIAAVTWKAALDPTLSIQIQSRIGKLPPREIITAHSDLPFGLSEAEMEWQLEMFSQIAAMP